MGQVDKSQFPSELNKLFSDFRAKGYIDKYDFLQNNLFEVIIGSEVKLQIKFISAEVVRITFLEKYHYDEFVYEDKQNDDLEFLKNRLYHLIQALSKKNYTEYCVYNKKHMFIRHEVDIEFQPLGDGKTIATFVSKQTLTSRLAALFSRTQREAV